MEEFEGKTLDEALEKASQELNVPLNEITYEIIEEKKGLFSKKVRISCFTISMVEQFLKNYVLTILQDMGFEVEAVTFYQDGRIYMNINTNNNSILIGKNGVILRTLNYVSKQAIQATYKKHIDISLDINGYKEERFKKVTYLGKKLAKQVLKTHVEVKLDPMPADERKVMHGVINSFEHLKTESKGEGRDRYITIYYVD